MLRNRTVGTRDDFFDMGGNSLKAVEVAREVHRRFGVDLALTEVLTATTVAALARLLDGRLARRSGSPSAGASIGERRNEEQR